MRSLSEKYKRISFFLLIMTAFLGLVSCNSDNRRVYFDSWEYSLDDKNYTALENGDLKSLEKLVPGNKGYIYVKSKVTVPYTLNLESYGLSVPRITIASQVFLNNREIATIGSFPPYKFSNGNRYTYMLLPSEMVKCGDENELRLKIYVEGSGGVLGKTFLGEYRDASSATSIQNFLHSILFLLVASFMLFTGIVYLIMFLKLQHDKAMIYFSLMSLSSIFFLLPTFIGNFQWALGFMDYDWFVKIFQGCFAVITAFLAASFSSEYIGLREPKYFLCIRLGILAVGVIYCLCIPDVLHFYKYGWITAIAIAAQVIPFIPSARIGLKMRAKIMGAMLGGDGEAPSDINLKNLPKGIPVGTTIDVEKNEPVVEGPELPPQEATVAEKPQEESPAQKEPDAAQEESAQGDSAKNESTESAETPESSESDKTETPPEDDDKKEEKPKVISRYGVPPPQVQKMLRERAAEFERKSKNKIYPKFLRKSFEEKVTYFIEMSEGMREPPEFMARMMGAPALPPNSAQSKSAQAAQPNPQTPPNAPKPAPQPKPAPKPQTPPKPQPEPVVASPKPSPTPASQPTPQKAVQNPKSSIQERILNLNLGKANPPPVVKTMIKTGQIALPGGVGAVPLVGEMDDISMAQLKYAENTIGTVRQLMTGYMPMFIALGADVILRLVLHKIELPYISMFGWQCTIVMFLFMLITNFAKIKDRGEYLSKNLREIVYKSTEELKQKAEELEKKNEQSQKDLEMAAQVQKTFYAVNPNYYGWDIAVSFLPLSSVSGDLYDFYEMEGILRGFGIYDVSGHGISAGLVTMLAKNSIFRAFRSSLSISLSEAILRINDEIIRGKGNIENYLTGALFRVDRENPSVIEMVNAGSPYPILKPAGEHARLLKPRIEDPKTQHGMLGIAGLDVAFCTVPFILHDGDTLVLYTDGITEVENTEGEQYGKERLLKLISEMPDAYDSDTVLSKIKIDVEAFVGSHPLEDDITVIVLKRNEDVAVIEAEEDFDDLEDAELLEIDDDDELISDSLEEDEEKTSE